MIDRTIHRRQAPDGENVPDELQRTTREEFQALHDVDNDRYIFTTDNNIVIMCTQRHWFCDGTCDSASEGCQLYTIHIVANGSRTVLRVDAIARNKNRNTYDRIFGYLKERESNLDPLSVTVDFEQAPIASLGTNARMMYTGLSV